MNNNGQSGLQIVTFILILFLIVFCGALTYEGYLLNNENELVTQKLNETKLIIQNFENKQGALNAQHKKGIKQLFSQIPQSLGLEL